MFSPGFRLRIHRTHCWFIRSYEELLYQDLYCLKQYADIRLKVNEYRHPIYFGKIQELVWRDYGEIFCRTEYIQ